MRTKIRWIGYSLLVGVAWAVVPYLIGRVSFLEDLAYRMEYPGVVLADNLLGESIHDTVWEIPLAFVMNILVAACVVFLFVWIASLFSKNKATPPRSTTPI
jgi:hypothetical protein